MTATGLSLPCPLRESSALGVYPNRVGASLPHYFVTSLPHSVLASFFQLSHQPWNDHLAENHRIGPHLHLPSQVPALRVDPRLLRNIAAAQNQIDVRDRNLCIEDSRDDQHRRRRVSKELLVHRRSVGKAGDHT